MVDLGLEGLLMSGDVVAGNIDNITEQWACDWLTLKFISTVDFTADINLYRLYAHAYNIDIEGLSDNELTELANEYKTQLYLFITQHVQCTISTILARWKTYSTNGEFRSLFRIPAACNPLLYNLVSIKNSAQDTDMHPHIISFLASLFDARTHKNTYTYDKPDVFNVVPCEQFLTYLELVERRVDKLFAHCTSDTFDISRFNTKYTKLLELVQSVLLMCVPGDDTAIAEVLDIYKLYVDVHKYEPVVKPIASCLSVAHAVCINSHNLDVIKCVDDECPITDACRLVVTTLHREGVAK